ncbi:MAG: MmpS family protein [Actinomycetia bacterium]|nr:MmpS family protein [Actinomycetes bacterium]
MKGISIGKLVTRWWMVLVTVLVVAAAGFSVYRLHGIFGSDPNASAGGAVIDDIVAFNPKEVVLEVFGPPGTVATVNYMDVDAQPQSVVGTTLPWSHTITTTDPSVFANVNAQGDSNSIGCRIVVDGVVTDERVSDNVNAFTFCLDKSS